MNRARARCRCQGCHAPALRGVAPMRSSAARAALRELRSLLRLFGPVMPVKCARDRLVCTARCYAMR
ncbi:hypothetical protein F3J44_25615 [Pantoea sp. Tr-811]|nr:hypothetical protein [Pantoea sp. Tr-811]